MRPSNSKTAFTLVELLVVIAIIGTLMGLLLPAVQSAREAGRRNTCTNNLSQLGKAITSYDAARQSIPGWRNRIATSSGTTYPSWPIMILPQLERLDVYRIWESGAMPANSPPMAIFSCPSSPGDTSATNTPLAYAANAGSAIVYAGSQVKGDGVFFDTVGVSGTYSLAKTNLDVISAADGASNTLLFSEKNSQLMPGQPGANTSMFNVRTGTVGTFETTIFSCSSASPSLFGVANDVTASNGKVLNTLSANTSGDFGYLAQPSSNHPGGSVAVFADGHTAYLKDSIMTYVYAALITPDSKYNGAYPQNSPRISDWLIQNAPTPLPYLIRESDY